MSANNRTAKWEKDRAESLAAFDARHDWIADASGSHSRTPTKAAWWKWGTPRAL